jgi:hypothetical protein
MKLRIVMRLATELLEELLDKYTYAELIELVEAICPDLSPLNDSIIDLLIDCPGLHEKLEAHL